MTTRKLFLEVADPVPVAAAVEHALFVPTRMSCQLGDELILALRLSNAKRALELPVTVVGRRPPRSGSLLSAGVLVRLSDPNHPLVEVLHELAAGRVVDLEARLQERLRLPAKVTFRDRDDAAGELLGLLGEDGATLPVTEPFARGDRLALDVVVDAGVVLTVNVLVRRLQTQDGRGAIVATALDDAARSVLGAFLDDTTAGSALNRRA
ncbi:MAG: hypothetical protein Q8O67_09825 [Deltaproteobacteria bacterium]|nr:hypothetical protein [Deltaproteobacteria bacterium]